MIESYIYALISVTAVSLVSLVGVFTLSIKEEILKKYVFLLVSLAVGALLGDAFIHLIPKAFEKAADPLLPSLLIVGGIVIFFILEKFMHWHHHGEDADQHVHPAGRLILFSDGVHNFIDGIIIGISFLLSVPLGIATTIAVVLHEIPQEIGDFAVLVYSGYERKKALWLNFLSAFMAVLGTITAFILGEMGEVFIDWVLPVAAGGFIYIAVADLIPELHKAKKTSYYFGELLSLILGVILMVLLLFLE